MVERLDSIVRTVNTFAARKSEFRNLALSAVKFRCCSLLFDIAHNLYTSYEYHKYSSYYREPEEGLNEIQNVFNQILDLYKQIKTNNELTTSDECLDYLKKNFLVAFNNILTYQLLNDTNLYYISEECVEYSSEKAGDTYLGKKIRVSRNNVNILAMFNDNDRSDDLADNISLINYGKFINEIKEANPDHEVNAFITAEEKDKSKQPFRNYQFTKKLFGDTSSFRISNNFDIGYIYSNRGYTNNHDAYLRIHTHVRNNGLEIIGAPIYLFDSKTLGNILPYLSNVRIIGDLQNSKSIFITGNKTLRNQDIFSIWTIMDTIIDIYQGKSFGEDISLRTSSAPDNEVTFRSIYIDVFEVEDVLKNMPKALVKFKQNINQARMLKTDEEIRRPMLPFNAGQLGLVLVSGYVDGIIDEGDGNYHVIKGSVSKQKEDPVRRENDNTSYQFITTNSHKTVVTIVTGDGTIRELF